MPTRDGRFWRRLVSVEEGVREARRHIGRTLKPWPLSSRKLTEYTTPSARASPTVGRKHALLSARNEVPTANGSGGNLAVERSTGVEESRFYHPSFPP